MYKTGSTSYLDVLLSSSNYFDMLSTYDAVKQIADADNKLIDSITDKKTEIENSKKELEAEKKEVDTVKAQKEAKNTELTEKKTEKSNKVSQLSAEAQEKQKEIDEQNAKIKEADNALAEIARKKAAEAAKKNTTSRSSTGRVYTGGKFTWPCPGYSRISDYYGYRIHPIYKRSILHKGIDMAAAAGTAILAAADGTVIMSSNGWNGGYGNCIEISHGSGLVTIYAHCSALYVSEGQTVKAGQKIAAVGSTGSSTGNHLHFGVLLNGNYVNPASYLGM